MQDFMIQPISKKEHQKIKRDLAVIERIQIAAKKSNFRVVITGGYAVDGQLGRLTRPHNDIDVLLYGVRDDRQDVIVPLLQKILGGDIRVQDKGREEYYHTFRVEQGMFKADVYYLQVTINPFSAQKIVIKKDSSLHTPLQHKSKIVTLEGVSFEAEDPKVELEDKLFKRNVRHDPVYPKHDQDIYNLRQLLYGTVKS